MQLDQFLAKIRQTPQEVSFDETISLIEELYEFTPTAFQNGDLRNEAGQNNGSCKIFAFAQGQGLSQEETLHCFGDYYRKDVLQNPEASDHQNIRNFMKSGPQGIDFEAQPLRLRYK